MPTSHAAYMECPVLAVFCEQYLGLGQEATYTKCVNQPQNARSTCAGNGVGCMSASSSAYAKMVRKDFLRYSSLKSDAFPTREARDIVTCIFTLAKFFDKIEKCKHQIMQRNTDFLTTVGLLASN